MSKEYKCDTCGAGFLFKLSLDKHKCNKAVESYKANLIKELEMKNISTGNKGDKWDAGYNTGLYTAIELIKQT